MPNTTLDATTQELRRKADRYQEAVNFEAKLQEYKGDASSVRTSIYGLQSRIEQMERLNSIYTQVFGHETPGVVKDARGHARQVLDRDEDDYWQIIDEGRADQYDAKVQTAKSKADGARQTLRDALNDEQTHWEDRVESARHIQTLMADSREAERLLDDIKGFVTDRMWDGSTSISTLQSEWQALERKRESGVMADWEEFQHRHGLSDETISKLKQLSEGQDVSLASLDRSVVAELYGVDDLRNALSLTL